MLQGCLVRGTFSEVHKREGQVTLVPVQVDSGRRVCRLHDAGGLCSVHKKAIVEPRKTKK